MPFFCLGRVGIPQIICSLIVYWMIRKWSLQELFCQAYVCTKCTIICEVNVGRYSSLCRQSWFAPSASVAFVISAHQTCHVFTFVSCFQLVFWTQSVSSFCWVISFSFAKPLVILMLDFCPIVNSSLKCYRNIGLVSWHRLMKLMWEGFRIVPRWTACIEHFMYNVWI